MANSVRDVDKGAAALMKRLAAKASKLTVGIHAAEGEAAKTEGEGSSGGSEATLLDIATIHELGLGQERRSFIADWADDSRDTHQKQIRAVAKAVVAGKVASMHQGLARIGSLFAAQVQKRISDGIDPPLQQSTIDKKGSSKPLIYSGQLRTAVQPYVDGEPIK